jgi:hypothetical protein
MYAISNYARCSAGNRICPATTAVVRFEARPRRDTTTTIIEDDIYPFEDARFAPVPGDREGLNDSRSFLSTVNTFRPADSSIKSQQEKQQKVV